MKDDTDLEVLDSSIESAARRVPVPSRQRALGAGVRGRRRRIVRRSAGVVTALAVMAGVAVPLALLSPLAREPERGPPAASEPPPSLSPSPTTTASPTATPSASPSRVIEGAEGPLLTFVPPTHREGARVAMPVTFPDGSTAEVVYAPELDLASQGVRPYSSGSIPGEPGQDFMILRMSADDAIARLGGGRLLDEYPDGRGGTVGWWEGRAERNGFTYLAFQFGVWTVLISDYTIETGVPMLDEERAKWARTLHGSETPDGFLVLEGEPPLELAGAGEHAGPELQIGDSDPRLLLLFVRPCEQFQAGVGGFDEDEIVRVGDVVMHRSPGFASWCDPGGLMLVHVYQARGDDYIDRIALDMEIRNVRLAP